MAPAHGLASKIAKRDKHQRYRGARNDSADDDRKPYTHRFDSAGRSCTKKHSPRRAAGTPPGLARPAYVSATIEGPPGSLNRESRLRFPKQKPPACDGRLLSARTAQRIPRGFGGV